jgi:hypothetical protein
VWLAGGVVDVFATHLAIWVYGAVSAVAAGYRLLAERERRKTLLAPPGTVVFVNKGPGGPAMWLKVGDRTQGALWTEV